MKATTLNDRLRLLLQDSELTLALVSRKSGVPYHRLYSFRRGMRDLTLVESDLLHITLTGKTFISINDDN